MTEVAIEIAEGTISGGHVPWLAEKYPFSKLTNAEFTDDSKTGLKGPSFVVVKADNPPSVLAAGRKRLKHCRFVTRKISKEGDIRVWLHPDSPLPGERPARGEVKAAAPKPAAPAKTPA